MKRKIKKYGSQITVKAQENSADSSSEIYTDTMDKVIKYVNENYTLKSACRRFPSFSFS